MRLAAPLSLFLGVLILSAPVLTLSAPAPAELEHNRRLLARWKEDPAHYARLKQDLAEFKKLSPERQAALRQLDQELHQEEPAVRAQLLHVMDRYATWLERLHEDDRKKVEAAPTTAARLRQIRTLREQEWVDRLPIAQQEQLKGAPEAKRTELLAEFRRQERERRLEWQNAVAVVEEPAGGRLAPTRIAELPPNVQAYVQRGLGPLLSADDRQRLWTAQGQWPLFARTLLELVDKHSTALPGPATGPATHDDLPEAVRKRLQQLRGGERKKLALFEGRWPDYAVAVTRVIRNHGAMPEELGPCAPGQFPPAVEQFLTTKLLPKLTDKEKERLNAAKGRWPDYPHEILLLAREHKMQVPGLVPPGPRGYWDRLRAAAQ